MTVQISGQMPHGSQQFSSRRTQGRHSSTQENAATAGALRLTGTKPIERLWRHWRNLPCPNGSSVPLRRTLEIARLSDILPRLSLMERNGPYNMTVGLVGTAVDALWDAPITGMNAFDLTSPSMREEAELFYTTLLTKPCAAIIREHVHKRSARDMDVSTLYLPLADREGEPSYIIGCSVFAASSSKASLSEHLVTDRRQLDLVEFLDIGSGLPAPQTLKTFSAAKDLQNPKPQQFSDHGWWRRFLPSGLRVRTRPDRH